MELKLTGRIGEADIISGCLIFSSGKCLEAPRPANSSSFENLLMTDIAIRLNKIKYSFTNITTRCILCIYIPFFLVYGSGAPLAAGLAVEEFANKFAALLLIER